MATPIVTAIEIGDTIVGSATWAVGGVLTDPTAITITVTDPSGAVTSHSWPNGDGVIIRQPAMPAGAFQANIVANVSGQWTLYWMGTGTAAGTASAAYYVYAGETAKPLIATPQDVQTYVGKAFTSDDLLFCQVMLELLQDEAELHCNRPMALRRFNGPATVGGANFVQPGESVALGAMGTDVQGGGFVIYPYKTPVVKVWSVTVDGTIVDPSTYRAFADHVDLSSQLPLTWDTWYIGESQLSIDYTAGFDGRTLPGLRAVFIRACGREWRARVNDVQGLSRYAAEGTHLFFAGGGAGTGGGGLEGFNDDELRWLDRYRRRTFAI